MPPRHRPRRGRAVSVLAGGRLPYLVLALGVVVLLGLGVHVTVSDWPFGLMYLVFVPLATYMPKLASYSIVLGWMNGGLWYLVAQIQLVVMFLASAYLDAPLRETFAHAHPQVSWAALLHAFPRRLLAAWILSIPVRRLALQPLQPPPDTLGRLLLVG